MKKIKATKVEEKRQQNLDLDGHNFKQSNIVDSLKRTNRFFQCHSKDKNRKFSIRCKNVLVQEQNSNANHTIKRCSKDISLSQTSFYSILR